MKIYKWEWYVVLSRSEDRDVAQGQEGLVKGCILPTPLLHCTCRVKKFRVYKNKTFLLRS